MRNLLESWKKDRWFLGIGLAGLGLRLALAFAPLRFMLDFTLPDDAFYYFVISRNAALGHGFSFDGTSLVNGFHPLWALLLVPVYSTGLDGEAAIRVILALGAILDILAGLILASLAAHLWPGGASRHSTQVKTLALFFYAFHPRLVMEAVNGLETSLGMFMLSLFLWSAARLVEKPGTKCFAWMGGIAAGVFLARTDLAIAVLGVALLAFALIFRQERRFQAGWFWFGGVGLLLVAPWFTWSKTQVGSWVQSSAVAMPLLVQYRLSLGGDAWESLQFPVINYALRTLLIYGGPALLAILSVLILQRLSRLSLAVKRCLGVIRLAFIEDRQTWMVLAAIAGMLLTLGIHTFVRWYPRGWYFVPWGGLIALLAAWMVVPLWSGQSNKVRFLLAGLFLGLAALQGARSFAVPLYPGQGDWLGAAAWLEQNTRPGEVVGAFNSGLLGYFSTRTVINLDGVVNWDAIHARERFQLLEYLSQRGGHLLIDREQMIWDSFGPFLGQGTEYLVPQASFGAASALHGQLTIYRFTIPNPQE